MRQTNGIPAVAMTAILMMLLSVSISAKSYGQVQGKDQSGPVTLNGRQINIEASINPSYLPSSSTNNTMFVRAFQTSGSSNANTTIPRLNYRILVTLDNSTLLDQRFSSSDGVVLAKLVPDAGINGWQVNGQSHLPSDQIPVSQSNPANIRSGILVTGGVYHIAATIERGSPGLSLSSDKTFNLYVSVSQEYDFSNVRTLSGLADFKARSYNDIVSNLTFLSGSTGSSISLVMPFDWHSQYEASVPFVHLEVEFPKSVIELQANSYQGKVNGVELPGRSLLIDDFSIPGLRIVHVILPRPTLDLLSERIKTETNVMHVQIMPLAAKPKFPIQIQSNPNGGFIFELSWGPAIIASGEQTTFVMDMIDPKTGDTTNANFDFVISQNGTEVFKTPLSSGIGVYSQDYTFAKEGVFKLSASRINGGSESAAMNIIVQKGNGSAASTSSTAKPSGCLIATAAFGSELAPQVQYLRDFRDDFIMRSESGAAFMGSFNTVYYSFSPQVADYERQEPWLQASVRALVYPLLGILTLSEKAHYIASGEDAGAMISGAVASNLIGAVYLWPIGVVTARKTLISAKWSVTVLGASAAMMAGSAVALPSILPFTTSAFVVVSAGISALLFGRLIGRGLKFLTR